MAMALPMATASGAVSSKIFKAMVHLDQDEDDFFHMLQHCSIQRNNSFRLEGEHRFPSENWDYRRKLKRKLNQYLRITLVW